MSVEVALARVEEKLDRVIERLEAQKDHNDRFYEVRDIVLNMKANAKGAWFTIGIFGTLTVAVSGFVAWAVSVFKV